MQWEVLLQLFSGGLAWIMRFLDDSRFFNFFFSTGYLNRLILLISTYKSLHCIIVAIQAVGWMGGTYGVQF